MAKRMRKVMKDEKKGDINFNIVEMGGKTLKRELQRSNPTATPGCTKQDCIGCRRKKGEGGPCHKNNVNYEIECEICKDSKPTVYIGETSRNLYTRGGEHLGMREDIDSFMNRHMKERHEGEEDNFVAKVTHSNKDCLTRQVREGVLIRRCEREVMNSRTEWFQPPLFRIRTEIENS